MSKARNEGKRHAMEPEVKRKHDEEQSRFNTITTMMGYAALFIFGHLRDFFALLTGRSRYLSELYVVDLLFGRLFLLLC
jgi:hypothetical protein